MPAVLVTAATLTLLGRPALLGGALRGSGAPTLLRRSRTLGGSGAPTLLRRSRTLAGSRTLLSSGGALLRRGTLSCGSTLLGCGTLGGRGTLLRSALRRSSLLQLEHLVGGHFRHQAGELALELVTRHRPLAETAHELVGAGRAARGASQLVGLHAELGRREVRSTGFSYFTASEEMTSMPFHLRFGFKPARSMAPRKRRASSASRLSIRSVGG